MTSSMTRWTRGVVMVMAWAMATVFVSARAEEPFTPVAAGVRYRKIGTYDKARLAAILDTGLDAFMGGSTMKAGDFKASCAAPRHAVTLYEVHFDSVIPEWDNQPTLGSGLLAVPEDGGTSHPLLSYQHGTVFGRDEVPSRPDKSFETQLALAAFASQGYVVIGADYFGLGPSRVPNCFIVPRGTTQAMLDHYRASRAVLAALGQETPKFFVWGWSQGGWSTMQFLRRLETLGIPVTAAATVSAPVDLTAAFRRPIANPRPEDAAWIKGCISNMLWSQEEYAQLPGLAASAIKPEHLASSRKFFDGTLAWPDYDASVPGGMAGLLRPEFIAGAETGRGRFWDLLEAAGAYRWKIKTPLRAYGGGADEAIPPEVSRMVADFSRLLGSTQVEFFSAGDRADHRASYVSATLEVKRWFDGFVTNAPAAAARDTRADAVLAADDERIAAMTAADPTALASLLSADLRYSHSNGAVDSKDSLLALIGGKATRYVSYRPSERGVAFASPEIALQHGRAEVVLEKDGKRTDAVFLYLAVWRLEEGRWRFLQWQSARLPPPESTALKNP